MWGKDGRAGPSHAALCNPQDAGCRGRTVQELRAEGKPAGDFHRGRRRRTARGSCWDSWGSALRSQPGQVGGKWPQPQHRSGLRAVSIQPPRHRRRTSQRLPPPSKGSWGPARASRGEGAVKVGRRGELAAEAESLAVLTPCENRPGAYVSMKGRR